MFCIGKVFHRNHFNVEDGFKFFLLFSVLKGIALSQESVPYLEQVGYDVVVLG